MDKIADKMREAFDVTGDNEYLEDIAKQIRQQIGRELFKRHHQGWVHSDDIRAVCKMDE